ncbi:MAG: RNB domain-containing ribonuclease [Deltaproteobacteria bacterium]|nr:RNB domain-containing ribonuclease [Deltaproteobacteria bacterium]MBW1949734.1 RNB domain-containing ribonuclease [Deltaproteobacteria bacterium]MBW2007878.1 RNB domain-containing ribonuclease [Deltaproteobacteria bacterium]MBW2103605.1 RNB domain-containing ribonuclease [Deltaproteobacteria bacterium]MBW2348385.1 RNB domain-containing ribonuclease [Deltaproteobacteria bacterium]
MTQGRVVEYIDQGRFVCAVCLQDKGGRLHLLTLNRREVNIPPKRALSISRESIPVDRPREEILDRLRRVEEARSSLKEQVNVQELWELIHDEQESFDHRYLAQLCFGEQITDDHCSALMRALFEDRLHFKLKDGRFLPHSLEKVEALIKQREEEAIREERLRQGSLWIKGLTEGRETDPPACAEEIVEVLKQLALHGKEAPDYKFGAELLSRAGTPGGLRAARRLLVRMGVWEEDENLDLIRLEIPTDFPESALEESERLARRPFSGEGREDLRDLPVITIDGPATLDFDDALSVVFDGDDVVVGIHITDVAALIPPDSPVDREALLRASSLYLPGRQVPMIPPDLSQEALSLKEGCDRPALSLLTRFDSEGNLKEHRFTTSLIRVKKRMTYDEVNETLSSDPSLRALHRLSVRLRNRREEQGALQLSVPELIFLVEENGLSVRLLEQETPSRNIIAEFMILYNALAARLCKEEGIPVLYRTQEAPSERLEVDEWGYLYYVFRQRRKLYPLKMDTEPGAHAGLGLDAYTQATSPIRRYLDLVVQRQIQGFLTGAGPVYTEETLGRIRLSVEPVLRNLLRVRVNQMRYWTLKYLRQQGRRAYRAFVLDVLKSRYRVVLTDLLFVTEVKRNEGPTLSPGRPLWVLLSKADPWEDIVEFEITDAPQS